MTAAERAADFLQFLQSRGLSGGWFWRSDLEGIYCRFIRDCELSWMSWTVVMRGLSEFTDKRRKERGSRRFRLASALSPAARHGGPRGSSPFDAREHSGCGLGSLDISLGIFLSGTSPFDPLGSPDGPCSPRLSRHQFARLQQKRPGIVVEDTQRDPEDNVATVNSPRAMHQS
jgi:hypothetical protein